MHNYYKRVKILFKMNTLKIKGCSINKYFIKQQLKLINNN